MQFLSDKQVADRYGVTKITIRRWGQSIPSFPPPVKFSPGCIRWRLTDLEQYEAGLTGDQDGVGA